MPTAATVGPAGWHMDPGRICLVRIARHLACALGLAKPGRQPLRARQSRRRRRSIPRARTTAVKRITQAELRLGAALYPPGDDYQVRPQTRGDCLPGGCNEERPCPWLSCRYHLALDVDPDTGSIKENFTDREPWELAETCALDVAERDGATLEEVGELLNVTRERIRQIESKALRVLKRHTRADEEGDLVLTPAARTLLETRPAKLRADLESPPAPPRRHLAVVPGPPPAPPTPPRPPLIRVVPSTPPALELEPVAPTATPPAPPPAQDQEDRTVPKGIPTCSICGEVGHNRRSCGKSKKNGEAKPSAARSRKAAAAATGTEDELLVELKDRIAALLAQLDADVAQAVEDYSVALAERVTADRKAELRGMLAGLLEEAGA